MIEAGSTIKVRGNPGRRDAHLLWVSNILLANGTELLAAPGAQAYWGSKTVGDASSFFVAGDLKLPDDTVAAITSDGLLGGKYLRLEPGQGQTMLAPGATLKNTRDALSLEDMLGRAIFLLSEGDKDKKDEKK